MQIIYPFLLFSTFSFFLHQVLMKDRCKLFCRVAGTTAYYQLKDRVIDGTPCGTDTYDICVQGLCRVNLWAVSMATDERGATQVPNARSCPLTFCFSLSHAASRL